MDSDSNVLVLKDNILRVCSSYTQTHWVGKCIFAKHRVRHFVKCEDLCSNGFGTDKPEWLGGVFASKRSDCAPTITAVSTGIRLRTSPSGRTGQQNGQKSVFRAEGIRDLVAAKWSVRPRGQFCCVDNAYATAIIAWPWWPHICVHVANPFECSY
jgi:hypothetical protein